MTAAAWATMAFQIVFTLACGMLTAMLVVGNWGR